MTILNVQVTDILIGCIVILYNNDLYNAFILVTTNIFWNWNDILQATERDIEKIEEKPELKWQKLKLEMHINKKNWICFFSNKKDISCNKTRNGKQKEENQQVFVYKWTSRVLSSLFVHIHFISFTTFRLFIPIHIVCYSIFKHFFPVLFQLCLLCLTHLLKLHSIAQIS